MEYAEKLHANVARFLLDEKNEEAAALLLSCTAGVEENDNWGKTTVTVYLTGPRAVYDELKDKSSSVYFEIKTAFQAYLDAGVRLESVVPRIEVSAFDPDWKLELLDLLKGRAINNQGAEFEPEVKMRLWMNLRFRSQSEIKIAEALERNGVLFLPNCLARVGTSGERKNREADFLICDDGRWGIIEVDGEPFHPPSRTVHDHDRDRLFLSHSRILIQHFDAQRCYKDPDGVVKEFLDLLRKH